jgi:diketogulonate reductase-like aldo/keto reductase
MKLSITCTRELNNGNTIPLFGLGVYQARQGSECEQAVLSALEAGYRHIDTAAIYRNEESVGAAIKKSKVPRDEIFLTTKLWNSDHDDPEGALKASLKRLGLSYVDLYLIHWPVEKKRLHAWHILEKLYKKGLAKNIGVSNFTVRHLKDLMAKSNVVPAVNQVEFSPFLNQTDLLAFCEKEKIALEAYSPLTKGEKFKDKTLMTIAKKYGKTPAQILIRWCLQHDVIVIPKSVRKERILENADIFDFEISAPGMKTLDNLNEEYRTSWDPTDIP